MIWCLNWQSRHIQDKIEMFFHDSTNSNCLINHHQSYQCRVLISPPPPFHQRNTAPTTFVLGTNTRKSCHPIFIPSNIIMRTAKNTPNYTAPMSWFSATTSPKSPDGIGRQDVLPRIAPTQTGMLMSEPGRNTRYTERRTHSSMK